MAVLALLAVAATNPSLDARWQASQEPPTSVGATARTRRVKLTGIVRGALKAAPLEGVRVECEGVQAHTRGDGSFELTDVRIAEDREFVRVALHPPAGMHLPAFPLPDLGEGDALDLGEFKLKLRPHLVLGEAGKTDPAGGPAFWFVSTLPDRFLGAPYKALSRVPALTYDGAWIHLPPASITQGARAQVCAAIGSERGVVTLSTHWTPQSHRRDRFRFLVQKRTGVTVRALLKPTYKGTLAFRQTHVAVPKDFREAAAAARPDLDIAALLSRGAAFFVETRKPLESIPGVAPGRYSVSFTPNNHTKPSATVTYDTASRSRLRFK